MDHSFSLVNNVRIVTATSLFDGHDAAIHIMRRILQAEGAEVIHLGHNRSAEEVVKTAVQEDAQGIALSSYQGGHMEYFAYVLKLLKDYGAGHVKVFGGGGGVISPAEIQKLESIGVTKIFSPDDGRQMGLTGMIRYLLKECDFSTLELPVDKSKELALGRILSRIEAGHKFEKGALKGEAKVLGITGPGGAGKSSLTDEILCRFLECYPEKSFAVLSIDPTKKRTGGALLGDRIRMNTAGHDRVFMRSMATREANSSVSSAVKESLAYLKNQDFDLVILETAGIGQSGSEVSDYADLALYVMTPEFGAPTQLEKIDMLDCADIVALNKSDKQGAADALRDVQKAFQRNNGLFNKDSADMPVFLTCAHIFNDRGTNEFFTALQDLLETQEPGAWQPEVLMPQAANVDVLIPAERSHYLSEIVSSVRSYKKESRSLKYQAESLHSLYSAIKHLRSDIEPFEKLTDLDSNDESLSKLVEVYNSQLEALGIENKSLIETYFEKRKAFESESTTYKVRDKEICVDNYRESLSHLQIPKVKLPELSSWGDILEFSRQENSAGEFPFTNGVFPFKRSGEDPTRMFAGEGHAEQTNNRFHFVSQGQAAARLSTAFDSVTLYGEDPASRPDIYGKIGNAGVSICSLDDAKRLYSGFDLCAPSTSVSMTINGPAPIILAFFLNAAIDAECERQLKREGKWSQIEKKIQRFFAKKKRPEYRAELPVGHDGMGLGFLGLSAEKVVPAEFYLEIKKKVLSSVRGTVQADILKEDQAQNTCIFSTQFALRMMGDIQEYFIENHVRNFYSVSISGYHIAEAGATPVTQLAFTLANGFTLLKYYLSRGMSIDDFAKNLSFFFSNGMDPEYAVIGRVARRIWAIVLKNLYKANERSQKLKYHIQTSGRSLHAQEIEFNDIRTTIQALYAIADNCNSLHTNAYDEALTTPTEKSVRRAIAIQMILNHECGMLYNENPLQGSYFIDSMTEKVEEAVLDEFLSLNTRGGVLGAMETMYQRSKIQEESMEYEHQKHSGELKLVGVNFWTAEGTGDTPETAELRRSSDECKKSQVKQVRDLQNFWHAESEQAILQLKKAAREGGSIFEELMDAVKVCTLGQLTHALFDVGGAYRRNM
ncbi:MAG: methylmalonyl-CoA mutase family protein [Lentisphaerales bacterium]|nr:methylmalonyl-CoA mutase family protein [Lentisphaerales bacterium]